MDKEEPLGDFDIQDILGAPKRKLDNPLIEAYTYLQKLDEQLTPKNIIRVGLAEFLITTAIIHLTPHDSAINADASLLRLSSYLLITGGIYLWVSKKI